MLEKLDHTHFHYTNLAYNYYITKKTKGRNQYQVKLKEKKKTETRGDKARQSKLVKSMIQSLNMLLSKFQSSTIKPTCKATHKHVLLVLRDPINVMIITFQASI